MTCHEARSLMLEADLDDLVPGDATPLGAHLASCESCRARAAEIVRAEAALRARIEAAAPARSEALALRLAAAGARDRRTLRRLGTGLGLAAAAGLAVLLAIPRGARGPLPASATSPAPTAARFTVIAPPDRSVIVLQPVDTNIVIAWFTRRT